jgi:glycerol transport system substrate-binding protein
MLMKMGRQRPWMLLAALLAFVLAGSASADMTAAKKWVDSEFQPSTLTKAQQLKEMEWFIKAA